MTIDNRDKGTWATWGVHLISEVESNASGLEEANQRLNALSEEVHKLQREIAVLHATIAAENVTTRLHKLSEKVSEFTKEQDKINTRSAIISNVGVWLVAAIVAAVVSAIARATFGHV